MSTVISTKPTAVPATVTTWEVFRSRLEDQRADCVHQRALAMAEAATSMPDPVATRRAASMLFSIDEIDAALDRIAEGTYGKCAVCGTDIPIERLETLPSAAGCVACQASAP